MILIWTNDDPHSYFCLMDDDIEDGEIVEMIIQANIHLQI